VESYWRAAFLMVCCTVVYEINVLKYVSSKEGATVSDKWRLLVKGNQVGTVDCE